MLYIFIYLQRGTTALYLACNRQHTAIALMLLHAGCHMDDLVEVRVIISTLLVIIQAALQWTLLFYQSNHLLS